MHTRNRRIAGAMLTVTLLAGGLAACGSDDAEADSSSDGPVELTLMAYPGQSYRLPLLAADKEGFFEDHGVSLKFVDQPNNLTGTQGMAATKANFGFLSTTTAVQGFQAGQTYPFVCGGIAVLQTTLIADTDSDLPSTDDGASWQEVLQALKGKTIGIQTPVGSGLQILFSAALEEAGLSEDDVTLVNLGGTPTTVQAALQKGSVDVAQINPPGTQLLETQGYGKPLIYMPEGPEIYANNWGSGLVVDPAWFEDNKETVGDFCEAYQEGLAWVQDEGNADAAASLLAADSGVPEDAAKLVVTDTFGDFVGEMDEDAMQATFDQFVDLGIAQPDPAPTTEDLVVQP